MAHDPSEPAQPRPDETFIRVDATDPSARFCFGEYFAELDRRFDDGFDVDLGAVGDDRDLSEPAGCVLIATHHGQTVGCAALRYPGDEPAEIKRMWVAPDARGRGLARRMLAEVETIAIAAGATHVRLDTNRVLDEAIALYRSAGYTVTERYNDNPYAHHWFEKSLTT